MWKVWLNWCTSCMYGDQWPRKVKLLNTIRAGRRKKLTERVEYLAQIGVNKVAKLGGVDDQDNTFGWVVCEEEDVNEWNF